MSSVHTPQTPHFLSRTSFSDQTCAHSAAHAGEALDLAGGDCVDLAHVADSVHEPLALSVARPSCTGVIDTSNRSGKTEVGF